MPDLAEVKRDAGGKWSKGQTGNSAGRRGYGYEVKFKKIFSEVFDEPTIRAACIQLKSHVFGQKVDVKTGQIVDDLLSTPGSRIAAWTKMAEYAFGKPIQPVVVGQDEDGELIGLLKSMAHSVKDESEERQQQFVEEMKSHLSKLNETDAQLA